MKPYFIRGSVLALTLVWPAWVRFIRRTYRPRKLATSRLNRTSRTICSAGSEGVHGRDRERRQPFVLQDPNSKVSYKVDDDNKVKDYVGKQVKITGTLDPSANVIHVDSIELVS